MTERLFESDHLSVDLCMDNECVFIETEDFEELDYGGLSALRMALDIASERLSKKLLESK